MIAYRERGRDVKPNCAALASALSAVCGLIGCLPTAATQPAGQAAAWHHQDLIVSLHNLPQGYSCDDLWYKFRDLLLALGARQDLKILVYQCGDRADYRARSPKVHLQFSTPKLVLKPQDPSADIEAVPHAVRLSPGEPASMRDSDCELMRQIKDELLPQIAERIVSFNLACAAPRPGRWPYSITVQTLTPINGIPPVAARAGELPQRTR